MPDPNVPANTQPSATADTETTSSNPAIPDFEFPFKPGQLADKRKAAPSYPGAGKVNHHRTPGPAPRGTRRSMGKR